MHTVSNRSYRNFVFGQARPKILEHMVDTVLQFEGDRHYAYRILRTLKNRFGSTSELGIYEMTDTGMKGIINPSEILITQKEDQLTGIAIAATIEGIRPLMIEGKKVQTVGLPLHWGFKGLTKPGYLVNTLTPSVGDGNSQTPEFKSFLVKVEKA